jgi:hypothetical protein
MLMAGLGASMIDTDNTFEKNNTSIYVTNGLGSRLFDNFRLILIRDSSAAKLETRINGNSAQCAWGKQQLQHENSWRP